MYLLPRSTINSNHKFTIYNNIQFMFATMLHNTILPGEYNNVANWRILPGVYNFNQNQSHKIT
jgi:hypothetical protein